MLANLNENFAQYDIIIHHNLLLAKKEKVQTNK